MTRNIIELNIPKTASQCKYLWNAREFRCVSVVSENNKSKHFPFVLALFFINVFRLHRQTASSRLSFIRGGIFRRVFIVLFIQSVESVRKLPPAQKNIKLISEACLFSRRLSTQFKFNLKIAFAWCRFLLSIHRARFLSRPSAPNEE